MAGEGRKSAEWIFPEGKRRVYLRRREGRGINCATYVEQACKTLAASARAVWVPVGVA